MSNADPFGTNALIAASDPMPSGILAVQHPLYLTDKILKIKVTEDLVHVTLGWEAPSGQISPQLTVILPKTFAKQLAIQIAMGIDSQVG